MGKIQISVCEHCGKKTCDGGFWKMVSAIDIKNGLETVASTHPDNFYSCTLQTFGTSKKYHNIKVGERVEIVRSNWVNPCKVTYMKVED